MTILIDQYSGRKSAYHEETGEFLVFVEEDGKRDAEMVEKVLDALRMDVRRNRHDAEFSRVELRLQSSERRHLLFAGPAPRGPKIEHYDLACELL